MKKKLESRRHKAIRRCVTVIILLGLLALSGQFVLTPAQSLRRLEADLGTGRLEVLWQEIDWTTSLSDDNRAYSTQLAGNENAVVLAVHGLRLQGGWRDIPWYTSTVDCTGAQGLYVGWDGANLFGRVKDPAATVLYIEGPGANETILPESAWFTRNGCRYFLLTIAPEKQGGHLAVTARDAAGEVLERRQVVW